jgi:putative ABC transport system ATP-binding protein
MNERELTTFRRTRIGIVFQQFNLIPTLDALGNVTLPAMLNGTPAQERDERGRALLKTLGLADRADHRPDALSGGEQQRVAIARALFFEPALLLADEPTGNLDQRTGRQIGTLLRELAEERGMTILMVTHEPGAAALCRSVFLLQGGRITDTFETEGLHAAELATRAQQSLG